MAMNAPIGGDYKPVAEGKLHPAVCTAFVYLGTQVSQFGENKKIWLQFELQDETREFDGKPYRVKVGQIFTFSVNAKSNLRKFLESWGGRKLTDEQAAAIDLEKLAGKPAQITVVNEEKNGKTVPKIQNILPYQQSLGVLTPMQQPIVYTMAPNTVPPIQLPKWVIDMITASPEFLENCEAPGPDSIPTEQVDADLPF